MPQWLLISAGVSAVSVVFSGAIALLGGAIEDAGEGVDSAGNGFLKIALGAGVIYYVWKATK